MVVALVAVSIVALAGWFWLMVLAGYTARLDRDNKILRTLLTSLVSPGPPNKDKVRH